MQILIWSLRDDSRGFASISPLKYIKNHMCVGVMKKIPQLDRKTDNRTCNFK